MASPKEVVRLLNDCLALDRDAVQLLIDNRVPCNGALLDHPTVQCGQSGTVGMLGILNGLCGTIPSGKHEGWGYIAATYDDDGKLISFGLLEPEASPVPQGPPNRLISESGTSRLDVDPAA
jgi:hypothetical protein